MKKQDKIIREALKALQEENHASPGAPCPSEELLCLFAEGGLSGPEKDRVQSHLSLCPDCLQSLLLA